MFRFQRIINIIDAHTAGEPIRIVTSGLPLIKGETMLERSEWFENNLDGVRNLIIREPRGHRDMFGCILTPPATKDGDIGVLFLHTTGQATMCGHGTIGVAKVVLEAGIVPAVEGENTVRIDTPGRPGHGKGTGKRWPRQRGLIQERSLLSLPGQPEGQAA